MSLIVSAWWTDPGTGTIVEHTDWEAGRALAGFEVTRTTLWDRLP